MAATVTALAGFPAVAEAAFVAVSPKKSCYRSGEKILFGGTGYTARSTVNVTSDGSSIGSLDTSENGTFLGRLTVGQRSGEKNKTYQAIDATNPAITASTTIKVSALTVGVRPRTGRPTRRLRIRARGFTSRGTLWAHIRRGRYKRNVRVGRLKGSCGKLGIRKRLFRRSPGPGTYTVQFDTKRRYSRKTKVKVRYRVPVFRRFVSRSASAGAWQRLP